MITNLSIISATPLSSTMYLHDSNYMPIQFLFLFIAIGFISWYLLSINKDFEILFGITSIFGFGVALWYSAYVTLETSEVAIVGGVATYVYSQVVAPQPVLQVVMVVCFLFSIIITVYITFLRDTAKKLESGDIMRRK